MDSDRRAVWLLIALGVAGGFVRVLSHADAAPGSVAYRPTAAPRSSLDTMAARAGRLSRPLRTGEKIDLDVATREEIARLPRIGPGLAARIVSYREENGPFGSLEGLDRVSGVGPTLVKAIAPHAAFSGRSTNRPAPSLRSGQAVQPPRSARGGPSSHRVSLNTATAEDLAKLPGIGPAKARAIVEDRTRVGPFRSIADLERVKGFGPAIVKRLEGRVQAP